MQHLRALKESPDYKEIFDGYLFRDQREEAKETLLSGVEMDDESREASGKMSVRFIAQVEAWITDIESLGSEAELFLEQFYKEA